VSALESEHLPVPAKQRPDVLAGKNQIEARPSIPGRMLEELKQFKTQFGSFSFVVAVAALLLAAVNTIWAVHVGVTYPIAIAVGYCTFVATLCLAAAISALQKFEAPRGTPIPQKAAVSGAWKYVKTFSVSDACRLMSDIEPGSIITQDCIAWARALLEAIERGDLPVVEKPRGIGIVPERRDKPNWHSEITREALKSWTQMRDVNPQFLQD
jgi:hypothetical protein